MLASALLSFSNLATATPTVSFTITPLPLTTAAQREQGVPGGEGFQKVLAIAHSASHPDTVYLGSDTTQVWKSTDGGVNWRIANGDYGSTGSRSLLVHPRNRDIVFSAGTIGARPAEVQHTSAHQGIYLTEDGGDSWRMVYETDFFKQPSNGTLFAIDSRTLDADEFTIYAASYSDGLLVSHDSGTTWSQTIFQAKEILEIAEQANAPGKLLLATRSGLFRFDGTVQEQIGEGLPDWPRGLAISTAQPGLVYAALGERGIYLSTDSGNTFRKSTSVAHLFGSINDVEASPVNAGSAIATRSGRKAGPFYTRNAGERWSAAKSLNSRGLTDGGGFFFPSPIAFHPSRDGRALTSSNSRARVLSTDDGGKTWSFSGSGYRGGRLRGATFASAEQFTFHLTDHGIWRTLDNGQTFESIEVPRMGGRSIGGGVESGNTLILSIGDWRTKHLMVSRDGGQSWSETGKTGALRLVEAHRSQPGVIYAGAYRSDDNGKTWNSLPHQVAAVDPQNSDRVFALQSSGEVTQLLVSLDRGNTWSEEGKALKLKTASVNRLEMDPFRPQRLYAATRAGVRIFDWGSWHNLSRKDGMSSDRFGGRFVETVVAHPGKRGLLFAGRRSPGNGMGNGVFFSEDSGKTWSPMPGDTLSNTNVWSININPYNGEAFIGSSHGIYRIGIDELQPN